MADEEKKKFESGATPGMLSNPFGAPQTTIKSKTGGVELAQPTTLPKKKFIAGQTPGMLKNPFSTPKSAGWFTRNKSRKGNQSQQKRPSAPIPPSLPRLVEHKQLGPYWFESSRDLIEIRKVQRNLTDENIEWIKGIVPLVSQTLVKHPPIQRITTEDVEVALLLESVANMMDIIETNGANFDPVRQNNNKFSTLTKSQRQKFWVAMAKAMMEKLS